MRALRPHPREPLIERLELVQDPLLHRGVGAAPAEATGQGASSGVTDRKPIRRNLWDVGVLKHAIMSLLYQRPRSGYEMAQEFQDTLNEFWSAKHSQIYPELKRMTADGLTEYRVEVVGTSLEQKLYSITPRGREEFMRWMNTDLEPPCPRASPNLQVFFSGHLPSERRIEMLTHQLELHRERLEHLRGSQRKFSEVPPQDTPEFGDNLVLMHAIMREENDCRWLERCVELCGN